MNWIFNLTLLSWLFLIPEEAVNLDITRKVSIKQAGNSEKVVSSKKLSKLIDQAWLWCLTGRLTALYVPTKMLLN
jgi:hypothetical protein